MRNAADLLGIQNYLVGRSEGVDFLVEGECGLTAEEIAFIRGLGDEVAKTEEWIFVFGSNEAGIHGAGAARTALLAHGAVSYQGEGPQGFSYAIPTKGKMKTSSGWTIGLPLPIPKIKEYVDRFIKHATDNPKRKFKVTQIGCGHAGFTAWDMAPLFADAPGNCSFDTAWEPILGKDRKYWGHV